MDKNAVQHLLENFTKENGEKFEVTQEGSLALLAFGDLGLIAWRLQKNYPANIESKLKNEE